MCSLIYLYGYTKEALAAGTSVVGPSHEERETVLANIGAVSGRVVFYWGA